MEIDENVRNELQSKKKKKEKSMKMLLLETVKSIITDNYTLYLFL